MTEDQIKHMVSRFLQWKLPEHFRPDNGIRFKPAFDDEPMRSRHWPSGTNLFDYKQAEAMVRHMIEDMPPPADPRSLARDELTAEAQEMGLYPSPSDQGWRDIESAPKDGTTIDVWRDGVRETVYWGFRPHCCGEMGQYCDSDWHGEKTPGWVCATFGEFVGGEHDPFTHWRPLPAPPPADPRSPAGSVE